MALATYVLALGQLVVVSYSLWVVLIFPGWTAGSLYNLVANLREARPGLDGSGLTT